MKIVSKYKDYYDYAGWEDTSILFVRTIDPTNLDHRLPFNLNGSNSIRRPVFTGSNFRFTLGIIGFCGRFYPVLTKETFNPNKPRRFDGIFYEDNRTSINYIYDIDLIKELIKEYTYYYTLPLLNIVELHKIKNDSIFKELSVAYFYVGDFSNILNNNVFEILVNISLSQYDFKNQLDAVQAHQEISMYISILSTTDSCINSSDIIKRDVHGFDDYSFKSTKPGDKKTRRKQNKLNKHGNK